MTVEELNPGWPVAHKGFSTIGNVPFRPWRITLPDDTTVNVVAAASQGAGAPFYWSALTSPGALHDHGLALVVGEKELALADAIMVEGSPVGLSYSWPKGGQDWTVGDTVDLTLYHLPNAPAATLPGVERPGRITGVTLVPTRARELTVTWEAPANAGTANVLDYLVYLKRESGEWSDAEEQVFTPSGAERERLSVTYSELEPGVEYQGLVYARNVVALGPFGYSQPVPAPKRTPATLSTMSLTGTSELDFVSQQARYVVQVDPGVTETTVNHETTEAGATSEVIVVRSDRGMAADMEDADPYTEGHQARLSSNGDTVVLVRVTSADVNRQDMYGVVLDQSVNAPILTNDWVNDYFNNIQGSNLGHFDYRGTGGNSGRAAASTVERARLGAFNLSYGDQSVEVSGDDTATVPYEASQITVTANEAHGGTVHVIPADANPDLAGHQVNLRGSHPGGEPVQTAFTVVVRYSHNRYASMGCYFFRVTRAAPTENDATLKSLEVSGAELARSFLYDFLDYAASASDDTSTATIQALPNQPDATVSYDPLDADDTADGYQRPLATGDNLVTITVTAPGGSATQDYTVTINRAPTPSTDPTLASLEIAGAAIAPSFQAGVKTYATTVTSRFSLITLDLETGDDGATIEVDPPDANPDVDGWQIPVETGANTVTITVTAESRENTETYTLTVNRNSLEMESSLASLTVAGATLLPTFNSDVLSYTVFVGNDQVQVTVTATGKNEGSQVAVDQTDQDTGTAGYQVNLEEGRNTINVTVTAMDMMTTREYLLTVFRTPSAADSMGFLQVDTGWNNYCGLRVDRTLACNNSGAPNRDLSRRVPEGIFAQVSVKQYVGCGLRPDGSQHCWENLEVPAGTCLVTFNGAMQIIDLETECQGEPFTTTIRTRTGLKTDDFSKSAEYGADICVLEEDGDLLCQQSKGPPSTVEGPFRAIGQTRRGVCAIRSNDLVRCWGYVSNSNSYPPFGTIDVPSSYRDTEFKFISGGYGQPCGIRKSDSAALCWKWGIDPFFGVPVNAYIGIRGTPSGEFSFVDSGGYSGGSCGVRVDGTVDCWDRNGSIKTSLSNAPGEADIGYHSVTVDTSVLACGLRKDAQMKCWRSREFNTGIPNDSPWGNNAQLLGIDLGEISFSPDFDRDVLTYTASVTNEVQSVTVKPILTNSLPFYAIYSDTGGAAGESGVVPLAEGENAIHVHVISADRTVSNTYTVTVSRAAASP